MLSRFYSGKKVFLTGHTGFKGSWLSEWLLALGAEVHGYALAPQAHELLFDQLNLSHRLASDTRGDLRDFTLLSKCLATCQPEIVFHLAAQPLVRLSYKIPVETHAINIMGTVHLLESVRQYGKPCTVVCITTDKCYMNREWLHAYREEDSLGGHDPYSASKAAAELIIASYRSSYFPPDGPIRVASARAGNVIGGGDWAADRIVPDCVRALQAGRPVPVRNKTATRPWQHVLEPLSGYLMLAAQLGSRPELCSAFNFGPALRSNRTVQALVEEILHHLPGTWEDQADPQAPHEASKLNLATDKAFHMLGWHPRWDFPTTIKKTIDWYQKVHHGSSPMEMTQQQIKEYSSNDL